jgi:2-methylcitrate dehydratase PrpD
MMKGIEKGSASQKLMAGTGEEKGKRGLGFMSITKQVVENLQGTKFDDFPEKTVEYARFVILDSVGSALAGSGTEVGRIFYSLHNDDEAGPSLVWGSDRLSSLNAACFINSSLSQILDFDDTYEINTLAVSHPGPAIVPLALTMADRFDIKGGELIRAIVLGYEMCMRFSSAIEPRYDDYFGFSNSQMIGAVTSSSTLLGLSDEEFINAYGLAVSTSTVATTKAMWSLETRPMSWIKDGVGFVSEAALMCSRMASKGFRATREGLDPGDKFPLLCGSHVYKYSKLTGGFGNTYQIEKISFKPYPTCRFMQSILDIIDREIFVKGFAGDDVEKIQIFITPYLKNSFDVRDPLTMIDAQFSLPYAVAMLLSGRSPSPAWYEPGAMKDPYTRTLVDKVELIPDEAIEKGRKESSELKNRVKILFKNNRECVFETGFAKGHPRNPFSKEDHLSKFRQNLSGLFGARKIETLAEMILGMGKTTDIRNMVSQFRPGD